MDIALNFHGFGSWSLFRTKPSRVCVGNISKQSLGNMPQMSYLKVCQYVKTEVLTRVKLGVCLSSLPSENHEVSEGK